MKLRLLLFEACHRHCEGCCNEGFDLRNLPVCMDWRGWDQILLTGGEPMLRPNLVARVIGLIRESVQTPIYLYTADTSHPLTLMTLLRGIEGVTVTLHEQEQVEDFEWLLERMQGNYRALEGKSLRLNVFEGVDVEGLNLSRWKVKDHITWIKDCPLPSDEVFMRPMEAEEEL